MAENSYCYVARGNPAPELYRVQASQVFATKAAALRNATRFKRSHPTFEVQLCRYALRLDKVTGATVWTPEPIMEVL